MTSRAFGNAGGQMLVAVSGRIQPRIIAAFALRDQMLRKNLSWISFLPGSRLTDQNPIWVANFSA